MKMQKAELEFAAFDAQDVIATSGLKTFSIAGFGDKKSFNATITIGDYVYEHTKGPSGSNPKPLLSALQTYYNDDTIGGTTVFDAGQGYQATFSELINLEAEPEGVVSYDPEGNAIYNGIYTWIAKNNCFEKQ